MTRIEVTSTVGPDGVLTLNLPLGVAEANREVVVTVRPADEATAPDPAAWKRLIESTAGSVTDDTFGRPEQGEFEQRETLP